MSATRDLTTCHKLIEWLGNSRENSIFMDDLEAMVKHLPDMVLSKEDATSCDIEGAINAVAFTINSMREVAEEVFA